MHLTEHEITGMFISYISKSLKWRKTDLNKQDKRYRDFISFGFFDNFEDLETPIHVTSKNFLMGEDIDQDLLIESALKYLNERERFILFRRFYCGYSDAQIAKELHIASQTVSKQKRRALVKLQKFLSENLESTTT